MVTKLLAAGVARVGSERPDGPVVDAMRAAGLVVYVISPNQIKNLRSRYGSAGNKDDQFDAYVLADVVRTDHRRLRPLIVDTAPTTALRHTVPARRDLVAHRIAVVNQMRAHLQICFPGAVGLFAEIDSTSACGSWNASPPKIAPTGSRPRDGLWAAGCPRWATAGAPCPTPCTPACARPRPAPPAPPVTPPPSSPPRSCPCCAPSPLKSRSSPPGSPSNSTGTPIFTSLFRSCCVRAARLLTEIGDARGRFPTADSLACLAGVVSSTRQSGKVRAVTFRWGADKQLRDAVCDFAADSRHATLWAADLYRRARARGHHHPHAVRVLARAELMCCRSIIAPPG
jgi:transposase